MCSPCYGRFTIRCAIPKLRLDSPISTANRPPSLTLNLNMYRRPVTGPSADHAVQGNMSINPRIDVEGCILKMSVVQLSHGPACGTPCDLLSDRLRLAVVRCTLIMSVQMLLPAPWAGLRLKGVLYPPAPPSGMTVSSAPTASVRPPIPSNRFATASTATAPAVQPPVTAAAAAPEISLQPASLSCAALTMGPICSSYKEATPQGPTSNGRNGLSGKMA